MVGQKGKKTNIQKRKMKKARKILTASRNMQRLSEGELLRRRRDAVRVTETEIRATEGVILGREITVNNTTGKF